MPTVATNGVALHYERLGHEDGPRLLFCNGSGTTMGSSRPLLDMLSAQFDLLAFDYRGMGASPPVREQYTMADIAADIGGLLDAIGWARTALAGLSFGGMVAQEIAVTYPDRIDRLALLATSPGGAFASYPLDKLAQLPPAEFALRSLTLVDRRWTPEWFTAHPEDGTLLASLANDVSGEDAAAQTLGRVLQLEARKGHDVLDRLHRVTCPTFVGSGRYDDIAPVVNGQAIVDRVTGATLRVYEDGGHLFLLQDPAAWPEIAAFLGAGVA
jgi:3-oxoadipate enol-lactonase